jgi:hypothetical protein
MAMITRRDVLASALGGTALALSPAAAQGPAIGAIRIEALPSVTEAWGPHLPLVKAELERTLAEILGPSFHRGAGTRLVVTIGRLWLANDFRGGQFAGSGDDILESTATLYDRSGRALASYPIRSTESASGVGPLYRPEIDRLRLKALARNNAWWIRRYIAG